MPRREAIEKKVAASVDPMPRPLREAVDQAASPYGMPALSWKVVVNKRGASESRHGRTRRYAFGFENRYAASSPQTRVKAALEIGDDIIGIFDSHGQPEEGIGNPDCVAIFA